MNRKKGFTLIEVMCVLVLLALLALLVGRRVVGSLNQAKKDISENQEKSILSAAEKWAINNSSQFDDIEGEAIRVGLDVVFVVDISGGMNGGQPMDGDSGKYKSRATVEAIETAVTALSNNEENRIGFVVFSGDTSGTNYGRIASTASKTFPLRPVSEVSFSYTPNKNNTNCIVKDNCEKNKNGEYVKVDRIVINGDDSTKFFGATYTMAGIQDAANILASSATKGRIPVIILVTDGEPSAGIATKIVNRYNFIKANGDWGAGTTWCLSGNTWDKGNISGLGWVHSTCNGGAVPSNLRLDNDQTRATITNNSARMYWNVINVASGAKEYLSNRYQSAMYFYTIGIGLTSDLGRFVVDPADSLESLDGLEDKKNKLQKEINAGIYQKPSDTATVKQSKNYTFYDQLWHYEIEQQLYNNLKNNVYGKTEIIDEKGQKKRTYEYPTRSFTNQNMTAAELTGIFNEIATEITEATKVTSICVGVNELKEGGYISKDTKISNELANSSYVIISENAATNQYGFSMLKRSTYPDDKDGEDAYNAQLKICKSMVDKRKNDN